MRRELGLQQVAKHGSRSAMAPADPLLRDEHFRAFGTGIQQFARPESIMVGMMCQLLKLDVVHAGMMAADISYRGKRATSC